MIDKKYKIPALAFTLLLVSASGFAGTYRWDPALTGGASGGGTGIWSASTANWYDGGVDTVFGNTAPDEAIFGGASGAVTLSGPATAGTLTFETSGYTLGGGALTLAGANPAVSVATGTAEIAAAIAGGSGLHKTGSGTLILSGDNPLSGIVSLDAGGLVFGHDNALGSAGLAVAAGTSFRASGARVLTNAVTLSGDTTTGGGAGDSLRLSGAINFSGGTRKLTNTNTANTSPAALELSGTVTLTDGTAGTVNFDGAGNTTVSGAIVNGAAVGSLTKSGGGTLSLSGVASTYTGVTTVGSGTIVRVAHLADAGQASSIGAATAGAGNLVISGTFVHAGESASSTNRRFQIGTAAIVANDSADAAHTLRFTATTGLTFSAANVARTLTLAGANTGQNLLAPLLANNGTGAVTLKKSGAGTWIVAGANTHTGGTQILEGALVTANAGALGAGNVTVASGAVLRLGDGAANAVTLGSGAVLTINGTLKLGAANAAVALSGGAYTFSGTLDLGGFFDGVAGSGTYALISGGSGTDGAIAITGYDPGLHTMAFSQGVLNYTAVPEAGGAFLAGALLFPGFGFILRRRSCRSRKPNRD